MYKENQASKIEKPYSLITLCMQEKPHSKEWKHNLKNNIFKRLVKVKKKKYLYRRVMVCCCFESISYYIFYTRTLRRPFIISLEYLCLEHYIYTKAIVVSIFKAQQTYEFLHPNGWLLSYCLYCCVYQYGFIFKEKAQVKEGWQ